MRDDKRPQLADLRESGSIEQDADIVMFTYREEYYLDNRDPSQRISNTTSQNSIDTWQKRLERARGKADVIIGKNRHGRPETVHLAFLGDYCLFDNLDEMAARNAAPLPGDFNDSGNAHVSNSVPTKSINDNMGVDVSAIPDDMPL